MPAAPRRRRTVGRDGGRNLCRMDKLAPHAKRSAEQAGIAGPIYVSAGMHRTGFDEQSSFECSQRPLPGVTVVIPTAGERSAILRRSIDTVLQDPGTTRLVIVLDGPDAATRRVVEEAAGRDRRVTSISPPAAEPASTDRGQRCRNVAVLSATTEVILALDDDVEPSPGLVSRHAVWHRAQPNLVVVGYMGVVLPPERLDARRGTARLYSAAYERACERFERSSAEILKGLWAGNFSVRREHWRRAIDAQTASLGGYHVDQEFGLLLREIGLVGRFDRALCARHWYERSAARFLVDAQHSGAGQARLRADYRDIRDATPSPNADGLRSLLWRGSRGLRFRFVSQCFVAAAMLAALVRWNAAEDFFLLSVWRLGWGRGAYEVETEAPHGRR